MNTPIAPPRQGFSPSEVRTIRRAAEQGMSAKSIQSLFPAPHPSIETIRKIIRRDTYANIPDEPPTAPDQTAILERARKSLGGLGGGDR